MYAVVVNLINVKNMPVAFFNSEDEARRAIPQLRMMYPGVFNFEIKPAASLILAQAA